MRRVMLSAAVVVKIHSVMANGWYAFDDDAQYDASLSQAKREIALAQAYGVDTMLIVCGSRRPEDRRYERLSDHGVWQKVDFSWKDGELVIGADLPLWGETAVRIRN